jgi:CYTH domain-containing protein
MAESRGSRTPPAAVTTFDVSTLPPGHGLPMEIERKFLLHGLPPHAAMSPSWRIEQGWLPGTMLRERLRRSVAPDGDERLTRTIKLGQPGERIEVEEPTSPALFAAMWPLTVDARIRKRRHAVRAGALTWEVDVFLDRDLVLAEVELEDVAQPIEFPDWLAPFIVREVTHETAFLNSVMAQRDVASPDRGAH